MRERANIPTPRRDIRIGKTASGATIAEDKARRIRVPLDEISVAIINALKAGVTDPNGITEAVGAPRPAIRERVERLNRYLLLDTPRARAMVALMAEAPGLADKKGLEDAELGMPTGLAHACVACGACCVGTDVGPLKDDDIERIQAIDWSPHLPDSITKEDWLTEIPVGPEKSITVMGQRNGRCVFLGPDKLCVVHSVAGAAQKPTICRQFPYTFTRTPTGVDVSYSMECRSWWKARQNGGNPADDTAAMRALIAEGAPIMDLPSPVPVWDGLDWSVDRWTEVRAALISGVQGAEDFGALVLAVVTPVRTAIEVDFERYDKSERFIARHPWGIPAAAVDPQGAIGAFFTRAHHAGTTLETGLEALAARYRDAGQGGAADRHLRLGRALGSLFTGEDVNDISLGDPGLEIWRDMALGSLYAHEPARRDDVMTGIALLALRLLAGQQLAKLTARASMRARTSEQDSVDAMVAVTKMLRGSHVVGILRGLRTELVALMAFNTAVFARGSSPVALGRIPGTRLPGISVF